MYDLKSILGIIAIIIALISYVPYFKDIFRNKTKPHAYSWLVWSTLTGIAFVSQVLNDGGAGAWVMGLTTVICLTIFFLALKKGEKNITISDKLSLLGAGLALLLWFLTNNPLSAIILIVIIDALGFYPTFRKSFNKPHEETIIMFFLDGLTFILSIIALRSFIAVNYLYPFAVAFLNWTFVVYVLIRRKQIK